MAKPVDLAAVDKATTLAALDSALGKLVRPASLEGYRALWKLVVADRREPLDISMAALNKLAGGLALTNGFAREVLISELAAKPAESELVAHAMYFLLGQLASKSKLAAMRADPRVAIALRAALDWREPDDVTRAIEGLTRLGDTESLPRIVALLGRRDGLRLLRIAEAMATLPGTGKADIAKLVAARAKLGDPTGGKLEQTHQTRSRRKLDALIETLSKRSTTKKPARR